MSVDVVIIIRLAIFVAIMALVVSLEFHYIRRWFTKIRYRKVEEISPKVLGIPFFFLLYLLVLAGLTAGAMGDARWLLVSGPVCTFPILAAIFIDAMPKSLQNWVKSSRGGDGGTDA